ncbi:hypothetical protein [Nonomuraea sp. NPDC002799]
MEESRSSAPDDEIGPTDRDRDGWLPSAEPGAAIPAAPTVAEPTVAEPTIAELTVTELTVTELVEADEDGWVPL